MYRRFIYIVLLGSAFAYPSCNNLPSQSHGPIRLGDSSTIVTEKDPEKLKDLVSDLNPVIPPSHEHTDTPKATAIAVAAPADTAKKLAAPEPAKPMPGPSGGLNADFNVVSFVIPNITVKQAGNPNLEHANGAVYTLLNGSLPGSLIKVTANVTRVSQRYISVVVVKNEMGMLPLETLSNTTDWEPLRGTANIYRATGLDEKSLEAPEANRNSIRAAVQRAAQRRRMSRRKVAEWLESIGNVRLPNQKPLSVMLRSVMWKIDGKDADGKIFSKQIRVDIPM